MKLISTEGKLLWIFSRWRLLHFRAQRNGEPKYFAFFSSAKTPTCKYTLHYNDANVKLAQRNVQN